MKNGIQWRTEEKQEMIMEDEMTAVLRSVPQIDFKVLFNLSPNPYMLLSRDYRFIDANDAYLRTTGRRREELIGMPLFEVFPGQPGEPVNTLRATLDRVLAERVPVSLPLIRYPISRSANGDASEDRYWSATHIPLLDDAGNVAMILQHTVDVTELQELRQANGQADTVAGTALSPGQIREGVFQRVKMVQQANETLDAERRHLRRLFEQAPGFVCILRGPRHVCELANKAYTQLVGRDTHGMPIVEALPELADQKYPELLDRVYATGETFVGHAEPITLKRLPDADPVEVYVDFVYQPLIDADGTVSGIFVQGHDVSGSHRLEKELSYQATHDDLTGLVNRREFERRLHAIIEDAQQTRTRHAMLYLDLDQFKVVNDTCGHAAGDELLRNVSELLGQHMTDHVCGTLARLGGDEFGVLLTDCSKAAAEEIAEEHRELVAEAEFCWEGRRFGLSISIGVVTFDGGAFTLKEVLSTADSACYLAKEKGRNRVHVYHGADAELSSRLREMNWVGRLRDALQEGRLLLYSQQIRGLGDQARAIDRREILVRLREVDGTLVEPMAFIPAAERYNLMPLIDRYILRATLEHISTLGPEESASRVYAVNLSGTTLSDHSFLAFVKQETASRDLDASQVCFEVTETAAVSNLTDTAHLMHELNELGFRFALDDFGSGMSSFGYLKTLPVEFLKIDGRFVKDIIDDPVDAAMVEAITKVAHVMGIQTIAEYAESDAVLERLAAMGVDFAQGFGVHRPEPLSGY